MKVAIVHDWFNNFGGAEKVVREILYCYPEADIYCLFNFLDAESNEKLLGNKKPRASFLQYFPVSKKYYRLLLPLFPLAIKTFNLKKYDLILSSSSCCAKGIRTRPDQLHICYCHSPIRYAWNLKEEYLSSIRFQPARLLVSSFLILLKKWDLKNNRSVNVFIANSENIRQRIRENYHRESTVIYPPVDIDRFEYCEGKSDNYLTVSRLVSYKKIELLVEAFNGLPDLHLDVVGDGPGMRKLKKMATPNVVFHGFLSNIRVREKMKLAKAFLAVANEDFGITLVEAQASGTPVIAPPMGGYLETVTDKTGLFLSERSVQGIRNAILHFESKQISFHREDFRINTFRFRRERFHQEFLDFTRKEYQLFYRTRDE